MSQHIYTITASICLSAFTSIYSNHLLQKRIERELKIKHKEYIQMHVDSKNLIRTIYMNDYKNEYALNEMRKYDSYVDYIENHAKRVN